jgi:hypothetical protein
MFDFTQVRKQADTRSVSSSTMGSFSIQPNIRDSLRDADHQLDDLFEVKKLPFVREERGNEKAADQFAVVCENVEELLNRILARRDQLESSRVCVRIGGDGGGGFLKVSLSVFDPSRHVAARSSSSAKSRFLDTGVNRTFIIAIAADTQENYIIQTCAACGIVADSGTCPPSTAPLRAT